MRVRKSVLGVDKSVIDKAASLDKYYTNDDAAAQCFGDLQLVLALLNYDCNLTHYLEPSAGGGAFVRAAEADGQPIYPFDIVPEHDTVQQADFINDPLRNLPDRRSLVTIGNPPFGTRGRLAAQFINIALDQYSDTVAFVLPIQFRKHLIQKTLIPKAQLVFDKDLADDSFSFLGGSYSLRSCFQVWTTRETDQPDLRLRKPPPVNHPDFEAWQYNNTRDAEKYFDKQKYQWQFAVPRQGFYDYSIRETSPDAMSRKQQWIFLKAKSDVVFERLWSLDYEQLAKRNTVTPGFGKADLVDYYESCYQSTTPESEQLQRNWARHFSRWATARASLKA